MSTLTGEIQKLDTPKSHGKYPKSHELRVSAVPKCEKTELRRCDQLVGTGDLQQIPEAHFSNKKGNGHLYRADFQYSLQLL